MSTPDELNVNDYPELPEDEVTASAADPGSQEEGQPARGSESADPLGLDLDSLRVSQDFAADIQVEELISSIAVRRPDRQWFVRVHPDPRWRLKTAVLEFGEDRELYLVDRTLWPELARETVQKVLFAAVTRQGVPFLWPVKTESAEGTLDTWNRSAHVAAQCAMKSWVRVVSDTSISAYRTLVAKGELEEPDWPDMTFTELVQLAFKDRFIKDRQHHVLKSLRGE